VSIKFNYISTVLTFSSTFIVARFLLYFNTPLDRLKSVMPNQSISGKRPLTTLQRAMNKEVRIRLKNSLEYRGIMVNIDSYMNVLLENASEHNENGELIKNYGRVVIRGNNVLFIKIEDALKSVL